MSTVSRIYRRHMLTLALAATLPFSAVADEASDQMQQQIDALEQQLEDVKETMQEYQDDMMVKEGQVEKEVTQLKEDVAKADEWKHSDTLVHLAGYADVGYTSVRGEDGSFGVGRFAPIFHFQYRDLVMMEAEIEFTVDDEGETDTALEYLTIDYFLNDYIVVVAGRFLSPIGQFRQNLHPSWINKLASAPPGFGHDGAAPTSDVGLQLRGGFPIGGIYGNYAAYISNGPELNSSEEADGEFELEGIKAEGFNTDADGEKVVGGRFGITPFPIMEIGISAATGKATVTALESADVGILNEEGDALTGEQARDYDVYGADVVWGFTHLQMRAEYVKSKVGAATEGLTASPGATWEAWYAQVSYRIPRQTKIEPVIRYADFDSTVRSSERVTQWTLGLNYLISNNAIAKVTYEFNDRGTGSSADSDRLMLQLAYGF